MSAAAPDAPRSVAGSIAAHLCPITGMPSPGGATDARCNPALQGSNRLSLVARARVPQCAQVERAERQCRREAPLDPLGPSRRHQPWPSVCGTRGEEREQLRAQERLRCLDVACGRRQRRHTRFPHARRRGQDVLPAPDGPDGPQLPARIRRRRAGGRGVRLSALRCLAQSIPGLINGGLPPASAVPGANSWWCRRSRADELPQRGSMPNRCALRASEPCATR